MGLLITGWERLCLVYPYLMGLILRNYKNCPEVRSNNKQLFICYLLGYMSMRKQASIAGGGLGERAPFYGFQIPPEIKSLFTIKKAMNLEKNNWKNILTFVNGYLVDQEFNNDKFNELIESIPLTEEETKGVISAIIVVARYTLKSPNMRQEHFEEDLRNLKFPEAAIGILVKMLFGANRAVINASVVEAGVSLPRFQALKWRVDITISNTLLQRVLIPTILGELQLTNGKTSMFEMSVEKFHEMRYNVALVLQEMEELDQQCTALKIA
ncbi:hypothetical protein LOD99_3776 [Oopsacas minuta]|uniref:COMM domain-containing protein 5 n=1 Tax=Oopsacas minuta TaxID=111878 RepID=A0AAV7JX47_9METZ|nr:hypothetical protein LOD99_3776 [Oopsacas minuta]